MSTLDHVAARLTQAQIARLRAQHAVEPAGVTNAEIPPKGAADTFADILRQAGEEMGQVSARLARLEARKKAGEAGWTDEGFEKLVAFARANGIADPCDAIPAFERENPQPEPVASGNSHLNFFGFKGQQGDDKKLFDRLMSGDTEGFLEQSVPLALREVRGG